ncbi:MAG: hypothetical protein NTV34_16940, partial [Proteobacteria bacterium]|nr:hypothetical protein [Pseudomonadota bacterium]
KDLKKLYFGGGATDVTDVWTPSVHITADQAPHATLRHELVHAISSEFGWHGLGFHPNIALTEGLAVALAPPGERLSIHSLSASLLQSGKISSLEELFSPLGFWSQSGPRAYTVAGSFLQFLFEQAGAESVRKIYSGTNFLAATGHTLPYWSSKWRKFIDTQFDPKLTMQSEALFRSKGLLREKCPHTKADLQRPRSDGLWTRLRQPVGWDRAQYLQWLSSFDQSDRGGKINLWLNRIKESAMAHSGSKLGMTTWLEVVQRARYKPSKTVEDVELGVIESDVLAFLGRTTESLDVLSELQAEFAVASPGDAIERQIYARFLIQRSGASGTHVLEWRKYLAGWRSLPEADPSDHWIMSYLRMRRDTRASLLAASAHLLMPVDDMDPKFRSEWHKILADRFFNAEEFTSAASQYRSGANLAIGDQRTNLEMLVRLMEMH